MLNHVVEAKRRKALGLVREGRLYDLGRVLDETVPVFPGRYLRQTPSPPPTMATAVAWATTG